MNDDRPHNFLWVICFGSAGFCGATWLAIATQSWPDANKADQFVQAFILAFIVACAFAILIAIPDLITHFVEHRSYWRKLSAIPSEPIQRPQETLSQAPRHKYGDEYDLYWQAALKYAQEVGGVSFSKTKDFFAGDHATWRDCFILPMVRAGYVNPVQARVETTCADGWTVEKIRWAIESGHSKLTPLSFEPPSPFEQYKTEETDETSERNTVFASTTRK